jgi:hypothetical protein
MARWRFLPVIVFSLVASAATAATPSVGTLVEEGWRIQERWRAVTEKGSFRYDFRLRTWNGENRVKEDIERVAVVEASGGQSRSEILVARKDGHDELEKAREEEARRRRKPAEKRESFPSPFDPKYRDRYQFAVAAGEAGPQLVFRPLSPFEGSIAGRARFDVDGRLRRVEFTLAKPRFYTKNLAFAILLDAEGNPARVESSGLVTLVVWKRRFESELTVTDVRPAPPSTASP